MEDEIITISRKQIHLHIILRKALVKLPMSINACIRLNYIPNAWEIVKVIMIPKPGKNFSKVESYRPISLPPIMSKLYKKPTLKRLKPNIHCQWISLVSEKNHSKTDQVHHITNIIEKRLKTKACALLSFLTLDKLLTEYCIEAYFIN
jgi:hypothetical protein